MPDSCLRKALARFDIRLISSFVNNLILLYNIFPAEKPVRYVLKHGSRFKLDSWLRTNLNQLKPAAMLQNIPNQHIQIVFFSAGL